MAAGALEITYDEKGGHRQESPAAAPTQPIGEFYISWPVANLRREPKLVDSEAVVTRPYPVDDLQETQLLYGELVVAYDAREGWVKVEAPEQPEFTHNNRWQGYPGWVAEAALAPRPGSLTPNAVVIKRYVTLRKSRWPWSGGFQVPMGARLFVPVHKKSWLLATGLKGETGWIKAKEIVRTNNYPKGSVEVRNAILAAARQFLGEPYYWGGRAGHVRKEKRVPTGVDCSALVNLGYRTAGFEIPRDAHEQFMASKPVKTYAELRPADLIFLAKETKPDRITHVMIFAGGEKVIEAVHEFNVVREITVKKKLGKPLAELKPGDKAAGYFVHFGRLIS